MKSWKEGEKRIAEWYNDIGPEAELVSKNKRGEAISYEEFEYTNYRMGGER